MTPNRGIGPHEALFVKLLWPLVFNQKCMVFKRKVKIYRTFPLAAAERIPWGCHIVGNLDCVLHDLQVSGAENSKISWLLQWTLSVTTCTVLLTSHSVTTAGVRFAVMLQCTRSRPLCALSVSSKHRRWILDYCCLDKNHKVRWISCFFLDLDWICTQNLCKD